MTKRKRAKYRRRAYAAGMRRAALAVVPGGPTEPRPSGDTGRHVDTRRAA